MTGSSRRRHVALICGIAGIVGIALCVGVPTAVNRIGRAPARPAAARSGGSGRSTRARRSAARQTIDVDGRDPGRMFDGVGAVSGGGATRLLTDYPPAERAAVLDYLFRPGDGAALQSLKVEIGSDADSTTGAEPSHERAPGQVDCDRGYEWWLMRQAVDRDPGIRLYGLEWGQPAWVGGSWTGANIGYLLSWLRCASAHHLTISYLGGTDERGYNIAWSVRLAKAIRAAGFRTRVVLGDDLDRPWQPAAALARDPGAERYLAAVGAHDACRQRTAYDHCPAPETARELSVPLWNSEQSAETYDVGAAPLARALNRDYIDGRMTGYLSWALVSGAYDDLSTVDTAPVVADTPWSGHYVISKQVWVDAQTTQFTAVGWRYLDRGSGYLRDGGSYVSLRDRASSKYSVIVETSDADRAQPVQLAVGGGLSDGMVHVWSTDLQSPGGTDDRSTDLVHVTDLRPRHGKVRLTVLPDRVYTFTTTTGPHRTGMSAPDGADAGLPMPYRESFDELHTGQAARYFYDVAGGFAARPCVGRPGMCYQQVVTAAPRAWSRGNPDPTTVVGDPRWWGDYTTAVDVRPARSGSVSLLGRVDGVDPAGTTGYRLRVTAGGGWQLLSDSAVGGSRELAAGHVGLLASSWHRLAIRFAGNELTAVLDGHPLATAHSDDHRIGQTGVAVGGYDPVQLDDLSVVPTAPAPVLVRPGRGMSATASSQYGVPVAGSELTAAQAVDGDPSTRWVSNPRATGPQWLQVDLGRAYRIAGVLYQPGSGGGSHPLIRRYAVQVSATGRAFRTVAAGMWPDRGGAKYVAFTPVRGVRYLRLVALSHTRGPVSIGELDPAGQENIQPTG